MVEAGGGRPCRPVGTRPAWATGDRALGRDNTDNDTAVIEIAAASDCITFRLNCATRLATTSYSTGGS